MKNLNILLALTALGSLGSCTVNYYGVGPGAPTSGPHRNVRQVDGSWSNAPYDPNYPGGPTTVIVQPGVVGGPGPGYPGGPGNHTPPPPVRGGNGQWNGGGHSSGNGGYPSGNGGYPSGNGGHSSGNGGHSSGNGGSVVSTPGSGNPTPGGTNSGNGNIRNPSGLETAPVRHSPPPIGVGSPPTSPNDPPVGLENVPVRPTRHGGGISTGQDSPPTTTGANGLENVPVRPVRTGTIGNGGTTDEPTGSAPASGPTRTYRTGGIKPGRGRIQRNQPIRADDSSEEVVPGNAAPADAPIENTPVRRSRAQRTNETQPGLESTPTAPTSPPQDLERR